MRNFLFSLRAGTFLLFDVASAVFIGALEPQATAARQMRLEFVKQPMRHTAKASHWPGHKARWLSLVGALDVLIFMQAPAKM